MQKDDRNRAPAGGIRKLLPGDERSVSAIIRNTLLVSNSRDYSLEQINRLAQAYDEAALHALSRRGTAWVYETDGRLSGFLCLELCLEGITIQALFVAPDRQRSGIGAALQEPADRLYEVASVIGKLNADIIALQEVVTVDGYVIVGPPRLLSILETELPQYFVIAPCGCATLGTTTPILYRAERLFPVEQGIRWYSDTPTVPDSRCFGNTLPRSFCSSPTIGTLSGRTRYQRTDRCPAITGRWSRALFSDGAIGAQARKWAPYLAI